MIKTVEFKFDHHFCACPEPMIFIETFDDSERAGFAFTCESCETVLRIPNAQILRVLKLMFESDQMGSASI